MKAVVCLAMLLHLALSEMAQLVLPCGTHEMHKRMIQQNPKLRLTYDSIEVLTQKKIQERKMNAPHFPGAPYRIQTVVHVLGTNPATTTDAAIMQMINSINQNLRGQDPDLANLPNAFSDEQAGNTFIELCLTDRDPNGFPTPGIIRTVTNTNNYFISYGVNWTQFMSPADPAAGGVAIWDRNRYLNILIVPTLFDSSNDATPSQRVGVSAFPGDPANRDCYVVLQRSMQQDGAHTHELGHWLNLFHTWGDDDGDNNASNDCNGNDFVDDTPNQSINSQAQNSTCTFPQVSCNNGPDGDMYMNYMDYSNCYSMFTNGQEARMIATLNGVRSSLFGNNCVQDITIFGTLINFYRAANTIQGIGTVNAGTSVFLQAGNKVVLQPGFRANAGSFIRVYNRSCCTNQ